jgi:hypothetical protein
MFLVRSAFWLGLAFVVLQPHGLEIGAGAAALFGAKAANAGQEIAAAQVAKLHCDTLECAGGKAALIASGLTVNPSQASTMQDSPSLKLAPVPRPRLARAG